MPEPNFLSIAFSKKLITREQAWEIYNIQRSYESNAIEVPTFEEIAIYEGYLSKDAVEEILKELKMAIADGDHYEDPLDRPPKKRNLMYLRIRFRTLLGLIAILVLIITLYIGGHDWEKVAIAASIIGLIWIALEAMFPKIFLGIYAWNKVIQTFYFLVLPISFLYSIWTISRLHAFAYLSFGDIASSMYRRAWTSVVLLVIASSFFILLAIWRHREIWLLENRIDYMSALITRTYLKKSSWKNKHVEIKEKEEFAQKLMRSTTYIMSLNPWIRFLSKIIIWKKSINVVSIWYLEPDSGNKSFDIKLYESPKSPENVIKAYGELKNKHHPVFIDANRLRKAFTSCRDNQGKVIRNDFLRLPDRNEYISLTGYAYKQNKAASTQDSEYCMAFDRSYLRILENLSFYNMIEEWIDFKSVLAYPVLDYNTNGQGPKGILLAFRNIKNGFVPEDKRALCNLSRLLSIVFQD